MSRSNYKASFGVAIDIDGVLLRGKKPIEGAVEAVQRLKSLRVPYVIMTNGGGQTEEIKAKQLSERLQVNIDPTHVCVCHTPMRDLTSRYQNELVLLVGKDYDTLEDVFRTYGFQNLLTCDALHRKYPLLYPDIAIDEKDAMEPSNLKFGAIFIAMDPIYWGRELQLIIDVLSSKNGEFGKICGRRQHIPVYTSCSDFQYVGEYDHPRFGAGAFRSVLQDLHFRTFGRHLVLKQFGKPEKHSFHFVENMLQTQHEELGHEDRIQRYYMIGDNPQTDIKGANNAGDQWNSILTRTGIFVDESNDIENPADYIVDNVKIAVELIEKRETHGC